MGTIRTVLFDLDGTLVDTAPDMAAALDKLCIEQKHSVLPFTQVRPYVSNGSAALVKLAFGDDIDDAHMEFLKQRYLELYAQNIAQKSKLFAGTETVLKHLESNNLNWGVVTNKPGFLTLPLMKKLKLEQRAACIVSGDSTPNRKPHPEPMHYACKLAGSNDDECVYIGDARRDIEAGNNAGMKTLIAGYGYIGDWEDVADWGADAQIDKPEDILLHI